MEYSRTINSDGSLGKLCVSGGKVTVTNIYKGRSGYKNYLGSKHWQRMRKRTLKIFGSACLNCGNKVVEIHHLTYKHRGNERPDELIPLCRECHYKIHDGVIKL